MTEHPAWTRRFLTDDDFTAVARAVAQAEARTSGQIRVHLERHVPRRRFRRRRTPLERAREVFTHLGMHRTRERHGVLIYVAVEDRKLAIVGDEGIHAAVGDEYWHRVRDVMVEHLRREAPRQALVDAVEEVGRVLERHFPRRPDDVNDLSDEISVD